MTPRKLKNHNALLAGRTWVTGVKTGSTPYAELLPGRLGHQGWRLPRQRAAGRGG